MVEENKSCEDRVKVLIKDLTLLEEYSQELLSFTPLPIFSTSSKGIILEVNPAFEKIIGMGAYELIGKSIEDIFDEGITDILNETLKKGHIQDKEILVKGKGDRLISVSVFAKARDTGGAKNTGCFFGLFDLTEAKKAQEKLEDSKNILEIRVAARTRELEEFTQNLEEKIQQRTQELEQNIYELQKINKLMVGRELKMRELKEELKEAKNNN